MTTDTDTSDKNGTEEVTEEATSYLSVEFSDDHNIEGMKVTVRNVTPLQITAAMYYLQRAANRLADSIEVAQMQKAERERLVVASDIRNVADSIKRGRN